MADKKPCDHIEVFMESSIYELRDSMNLWLKSHPDFCIDQMTMTEKGGYYSVVCDLCLRDEEPEEEKKDYIDSLEGVSNIDLETVFSHNGWNCYWLEDLLKETDSFFFEEEK